MANNNINVFLSSVQEPFTTSRESASSVVFSANPIVQIYFSWNENIIGFHLSLSVVLVTIDTPVAGKKKTIFAHMGSDVMAVADAETQPAPERC